MSYQYLTTMAPESFNSSMHGAEPVLLNTNKQKFMLIANPGIDEIRRAIEEHARLRMEAHWNELMAAVNVKSSGPKLIRFFHVGGSRANWVPKHVIRNIFGVFDRRALADRLKSIDLDGQRALAAPYRPTSIPEMLSLYCDIQGEDTTGYKYFMKVLESSESAAQFFGSLIDSIFLRLQNENYQLGAPAATEHQARTFELLGMATRRKWLLFPLVFHSSGLQEHLIISHRSNVARFFDERYRPREISQLLENLKAIPADKTTNDKFAIHFRNVVIASTFRQIEQCSTELFVRCLEILTEVDRPMVLQGATMARRTYNALIKLYNSVVPAEAHIAEILVKRKPVTVAEFASFENLRSHGKGWHDWASAFEGFVAATTDSQGATRKLACREFSDFLLSLDNPPQKPELATRILINDLTSEGNTYRNYLKTNIDRGETRNLRLNLIAQFFDYIRESLRSQQADLLSAAAFANPVDMKFDRFNEAYRAGTQRRAIASDVMELMRDILTENDYAWPKQRFRVDWMPGVNARTKAFEHVWCPSATILLYTLLTIPLRSLQGRLLDSGEADREIYDFELGRLIPNPRQLPIDGRIDKRRMEGALQVMPSGMIGVTDIVGMWICVNKTSDGGYAIPWVSDELVKHLRYQREWIQIYSPNPHPVGIADAQGHRNTPKEWADREKKFYCLFRDPSAEQTGAPSLPVSRQKLLKLWGALCAEAQNRINKKTNGIRQGITLVKPGTEADQYPSALFDIHTLRVSGITDLLDRGVPLNIVSEYVAGHATYIMTLWYDKPSSAAIRDHLLKAKAQSGICNSPLPSFDPDELDELKPHLLSHPDHRHLYTGFDALNDNKGLVLIRHSGICPGGRCDEGGLDEAN